MTKAKKELDYSTMERIPEVIGGYEILERLEIGNYSAVYRAKGKEKDIILKIAREGFPEFNQLIAREFQILSQFRHPNIVSVYEYDTTENGLSFFTMEYINGKPINECFTKFNEEFVEAIIQIINALSAFHNRGFVHSDLKPEHIIYHAGYRKAVLIDFGFAGITTHRIKAAGTIGYIAPEILKGIGPDQRSDLYSLGMIIYKILAKENAVLPFKPIKNIPEEINNTISRLLAEEPNLRPIAPELFSVFSRFLPSKKMEIPSYRVYLPPSVFIDISNITERLLGLKGRGTIIIGETGAGKTRILKELKYKLLFNDYEVLFFTSEQKRYLHNVICDLINYDAGFENKESNLQIYMEITEKFLNFAKNKKVAILVDDIEHLSDYEFGLFRYLGHSIENTEVILIGSAKPSSKIDDLNFLEIPLNPLSTDEIKSLMEKTFLEIEAENEEGFITFIQWLHKHSGGNPLFIVETIKTLYQEDILKYKGNRWRIDLRLLNKLKISDRIEENISARLANLDPDPIILLKVLSIADNPLPLYILKNFAPDNIFFLIEILKSNGLVKEDNVKGEILYSLANRILKMVVERRIDKKEYEWIVGNLIKSIKISGAEDNFCQLLGRLYEETGEYKEALRQFITSARKEEELDNISGAISYYEKCLNYCRDGEKTEYKNIILKLGTLYMFAGNNKKAIEYFEKGLKFPEYEIKSLSELGRIYTNIGDFLRAEQYLNQALSLIKNKESKEYIDNYHRLAYCYINLKKFDESAKILNECLEISNKIKDYELKANTLYYLATQEWYRNNFEKAEEICHNLLELCEEHKLKKQYAYTANMLSSIYIETGNIDESLKYIDMAINVFQNEKILNARISALNNKALLYTYKQENEEALKNYKLVLKESQKTGIKSSQYSAFLGMAEIFAQTCKFNQAIECYQMALKIVPDSVYANYGLSMIYYKRGEIEKAKEILKDSIKTNEDILYLVGLGIIYNAMNRKEDAEIFVKKALHKTEIEKFELSARVTIFLKAAEFYYDNGDFVQALYCASRAAEISPALSLEKIIADSIVKIIKFRQKQTDELDIDSVLNNLKKNSYLYNYAFLQRLKIEALIERGIEPEKVKDIAEDIYTTENIFKTIGAKYEIMKIQKILLEFYPLILNDYSKRTISVHYLNIFSNLAELINSRLGEEDFIENILDLVINATNAERGAIFINTGDGMKLAAGRNMDKRTIKDAGDLSKTAIDEVNKNRIVFVPDAIQDPRFNIRKSVLLNQIRSILCIPLVIGERVIGAIYLDSTLLGSIFGEQDKDFLITVSKILASVIDKSISFKNLRDEFLQLRDGTVLEIGKGYIMGKSRVLKKIYNLINDVAPADSPVLITGETGVGKGMIARLIHLKSKRRDKKFVSINCGTIPETLLESELFGYKRGAFTGAVTDKKGLLEDANGGTVFLDEITNTSPAFQAKMLEAIEDKVIRRLGETQTRKIDVRFLFATNKEIEIEVEEGRFRRDLYYRINVFMLKVPSLRERIEDIPILANFFLQLKCKELNKRIDGFSDEAIRLLKVYPWPGNVRELQNVIERATVLAKSNVIKPEDIGLTHEREILPIKELTKEAIINALNTTNWSIKESAKILGVSRRTIERYIKKYNLEKI